MKKLIVLLISMRLGICGAQVPELFRAQPFTPATLAEAVNHYVAMGEEPAINELENLDIKAAGETNVIFSKAFSVNERIAWVCRILFEPKGHSSLRAPKYGALSLPEKSFPLDKWPLYPVVSSGRSFFVLAESYTPNGKPETAAHYIAYCKANGVFRRTPVVVPTKEQAMRDAAAIRQSEVWNDIEWRDENGFSYPMGDQWTWAFIQNQAKTTPADNKILDSQPEKSELAVSGLPLQPHENKSDSNSNSDK